MFKVCSPVLLCPEMLGCGIDTNTDNTYCIYIHSDACTNNVSTAHESPMHPSPACIFNVPHCPCYVGNNWRWHFPSCQWLLLVVALNDTHTSFGPQITNTRTHHAIMTRCAFTSTASPQGGTGGTAAGVKDGILTRQLADFSGRQYGKYMVGG